MKKHYSWLALLLVMVMLVSALASCTDPEETTTTGSEEPTQQETVGTSSDETNDSETGSSESETDKPVESGSSSTTETETETETEAVKLEGEHAELIELANGLKNTVTSHYTDSKRQIVAIDNKVMSLGYRVKNGSNDVQLAYLQTPDGKTYIEETMDVFVKLTNGDTFYSSGSVKNATLNIYRYGYYYFENRIEGQVFANEVKPDEMLKIDHTKSANKNHISSTKVMDSGSLFYRTTNITDPWITYNTNFAAESYDFLEITMRVSEPSNTATEVFIIAGSKTSYNGDQRIGFNLKDDGEFHTYRIPLSDFEDYTGTVKGIRFDINTTKGSEVEISEICVFKAKNQGVSLDLSMQRSFLTYSDKLHHLIQLSTESTIENVDSVGMVTKIDADTVAKLVVKDKNGLHYDLNGIDWASAEYAGFDIKDAGIFGYILPCDDQSGSIEITLGDGIYTILQTKAVKDNQLIPSKDGTRNANDFFMGQRIYNDETHDFDTFLHEAECERHPLTKENVTVVGFDNARFSGYQPLYGYYKFTVDGTGFNSAYEVFPNRQYRVEFTIKGDDKNRQLYICTYTSSGCLESAALLDHKDMLLPVPPEISKNFAGDGENTIYNLDDAAYGETYLPMIVPANKTVNHSVINLYQNWGIFPLKQISSIQYHTPYYHLSTGVTETNCIVQLTQSGPGLPDHRAMSAPLWPTQPQHTSAGTHNFLIYTDADGKYNVSENTEARIDSYGPTYCDIKLGYEGADGKISATYIHTEMPQTDENRAYYEMSYVFNEDVSFKNFANDFTFYRVTDNNSQGTYKQLGYLDENNECKVVMSNQSSSETPSYILGDNCPYFSFFDMPDYYSNGSNAFGYVNLGCLIKNFEVIHNGEKLDTELILHNKKDYLLLSLNLGEITFKKGDTIKLNMILMPWGSEELDYTVAEPDKNVRVARENTLLDPLTITPGANCEAVESIFVPKAATTNGKSAEFTISGGHNNSTVRIYGFDMLTVPVIEEKVDGKWTPYAVNSISRPDDKGYGSYYDGYMVHYDGEGKFSYSFVIAMDNGAPRTFRISMDEDFKGWTKPTPPEEVVKDPDPINVWVDPTEFQSKLLGSGAIGSIELSEDGSYVRIQGNPTAAEAYITGYSTSISEYADVTNTGKYAVLKYRVSADCAQIPFFEFWSSTQASSAAEGHQHRYRAVVQNGEWQVLILDMASIKPSVFVPEADGTYFAKYLRLDFFDSKTPEETYLDIAYMGLCDSLEKLIEFNKDVATVTLVEANKTTVYDTATGKAIGSDAPEVPDVPVITDEVYIDPASGFTKYEGPYGATIDMVNGGGLNGAQLLNSTSYSNTKVPVIAYNGSTFANAKLTLSGWAGLEGGIEKYVWSADGGKTWNDCEIYLNGVKSSYADILNLIQSKTGYTFVNRDASMINGSFQGSVGAGINASGIAANLSAFAGQTVNVIFAAVPKAAPNALCVLIYFTGVKVISE